MYSDLLISTILTQQLLGQLGIKELSFKPDLFVVQLTALILIKMDRAVLDASFLRLIFMPQILNSLMLDSKEKQGIIFNQKKDVCFHVMRSQETL